MSSQTKSTQSNQEFLSLFRNYRLNFSLGSQEFESSEVQFSHPMALTSNNLISELFPSLGHLLIFMRTRNLNSFHVSISPKRQTISIRMGQLEKWVSVGSAEVPTSSEISSTDTTTSQSRKA